MALQLFSRLFTFALNQALFRLASPTAFGAAAIQLELLLSTILFLSREGVRNALLRTPQSGKSPTDDTLLKKRRSNLAFLPLLLGIPLALAASASYRQLAGHEIKAQPRFELTVAIYALAAVAELCSEPFFNVFVSPPESNSSGVDNLQGPWGNSKQVCVSAPRALE